MGLVRAAIVGPVVVYWALMGHVFWSLWGQEPDPKIAVERDWPAGTPKAEIDAVVAGREELIGLIKHAVAADGPWAEFASKQCTADVEFEDPWQMWKV